MSDNTVEVKFGADASQLKSESDRAALAIENAIKNMSKSFDGISSVIDKFKDKFAALTAVIAGGALFKSAINETIQYAGEVRGLMNAFGIGSDKASELAVSLKLVGISTEEYIGIAMKFDRQLKNNEGGLNRLGVTTRDANGSLLSQQELLKNAVATMMEYKAGTDRNAFALANFGRSAEEAFKLLKLNNDVQERAAKLAKDLGLVLGSEALDGVKKYKQEMAAVGLVMGAFEERVGDAVMPALTKLAQGFVQIGTSVIPVFKVAFEMLGETFSVIAELIETLWEVTSDVFNSIGDLIISIVGGSVKSNMELFENILKVVHVAVLGFKGGLILAFEVMGAAIQIFISGLKQFAGIAIAAFKLDWGGIKAAWNQGAAETEKILTDSQNRILKKTSENAQKINDVIMSGIGGSKKDDVANPKQGTKEYRGQDKKEKQDKSMMPAWEAALSEQKAAYMRMHDMYEMSLVDEKKYWDTLLAILDKGDKEYGAVKKKSAEMELQILKKKASEGKAIAQEEIDSWKSAALDGVAFEQQAAQQRFDLGLMTNEVLIQQERQFENERFEINRKALEERVVLMQKDPNKNPVEYKKIKDQIAEIERKHVMDQQKLSNKSALDSAQKYQTMFSSIQNGFAGVIKQFLQGTLSIKGLFQGMVNAVVSSVTEMLAQIAAKFLVSSVMERVMGKVTALSQIGANAAVAGSAAFASTAAIPIIGPGLAPGAAAAAYASTLSFGTAIPAAAQGFDIPSGINPMTQLHEKEMVLPAKHADVIRNIADSGASGGGDVHMHVHTQSTQDFQNFMKKNSHALAPALRQMARNFTPSRA